MAKAFLTSLALHAVALGLYVWLAADAPPAPSETPQLIELQSLALVTEAPPVAEPVTPPEPPAPVEAPAPVEPPPPEPVAAPVLPPPPEPVQVAEVPPPPEPVAQVPPPPEPPPEIVPDDLIRSIAPPVAEAPPPPKPKPVPKPRPVVAKSPPAVPPSPQPVTPVVQPAIPAPPVNPVPVAAPDPAPAVAPPAPATLDMDYQTKLHAWLQRHKPDAGRATRGQRQGIAQVEFTFKRNGTVISRRLVQSSGNETLDAAALEMIDRANPMPVLPAVFPYEETTVTVPVQFQLR